MGIAALAAFPASVAFSGQENLDCSAVDQIVVAPMPDSRRAVPNLVGTVD